MTYFCYIDESGTPELPGTSTHFVLVGLAIPIDKWAEADARISAELKRFGLSEAEIHTAWLLRRYPEQEKIPNFERIAPAERRSAVERARAAELLRLQAGRPKAYRQTKKNYRNTEDYIHLTLDERRDIASRLARVIRDLEFGYLFAELIDKLHFDSAKTGRSVSEQAFEQLVIRFDTFLKKDCVKGCQGVLIHDNNETVAKKHTELMRHFHTHGTLWGVIGSIAETPLFVDSKLTRMVQLADLCSYVLRRYVEKGDAFLFDSVFRRSHKFQGKVVGVRHFTDFKCECEICKNHRNKAAIKRPPRAAAKRPSRR